MIASHRELVFGGAARQLKGAAAMLLVVGVAGCSGSVDADTESSVPTNVAAPTASQPIGTVPQQQPPVQMPTVDPGTVTIHRLNRVEYGNTIRDLFYGMEFTSEEDLPPDNTDLGFDNIASALTTSGTLFTLYESIAEEVVERAVSGETTTSDGTPVVQKLISCSVDAPDEQCRQSSLTAFAKRAYRRPVTAAEVDSLVSLAASENDWLTGMKLALQAVLLSPHFMYRVELDPSPDSLEPHLLGHFELASRLSYFLWSSMPDDELFRLAEQGTLNQPPEIRTQVARMLASEKASGFVDNFLGQWLYTRSVNDSIAKDEDKFPQFTPELISAMRTEMSMFLSTFTQSNRDLRELLLSETTFVNGLLADLYDIEGPSGDEFEEVSLAGTGRRGLLTQAGLLSLLAKPLETDPIERGKWIVEQMMCVDTPPPPPGVMADLDAVEVEGSVRERLEVHREDPSCSGCHELLDPPGLALEHFDAIGQWRDTEDGYEIITRDVLVNGPEFADPIEMVGLIADVPRFLQCVVRNTLTYALGRKLAPSEKSALQALAQEVTTNGFNLPQVVSSVATSPQFRFRRAGIPPGLMTTP